MVRIRYAELQAGLHVAAEASGGDTVVYLLPGLTPAERRVALSRVRSLGRLGHGPRLSAASLAMAAGRDRIRTTLGNGAAAVRSHPILMLPSALVMSGTCFALVSLAPATFDLPAANAAPQSTATLGVPAGSHSSTWPLSHSPRHAGAVDPRAQRGNGYRPRHARSCVVYGNFGVCESS